ncbi:hypothetical protein Tco_1431210 [Tanacetum coccineum]
MFLNMDQLEKQLDNEEFQEIGSMAAFKVLETQFQMFIKSRIYLDDEYVVMTRNYFLQYTQLEIPEFHDTLIQHPMTHDPNMESSEDKVVTTRVYNSGLLSLSFTQKALDRNPRAGYKQADQEGALLLMTDIRPIYDEEPMAEAYKQLLNQYFGLDNKHI